MAKAPATPGVASEQIERLRGRLGDVPVLTDAEGIRERSLDTYWKAAALARDGRGLLPDAVVRPRTAEEVASTLAAAAAEGVPVVPRGGGSGSQGGAVADIGGIVLDLSALDEILELDTSALTVRAQAGVPGLPLQQVPREQGGPSPSPRLAAPSSPRWAAPPPRPQRFGGRSMKYGKNRRPRRLKARVVLRRRERRRRCRSPARRGPGTQPALHRQRGDDGRDHGGDAARHADARAPQLSRGRLR